MDHLYNEEMYPAVRGYVKTLREQSYVLIKLGYQDMPRAGNPRIQMDVSCSMVARDLICSNVGFKAPSEI
jgi:hypothetical protein